MTSLRSGVRATQSPPQILLTGASGYVGGHLYRALERQSRTVRRLARRPEVLSPTLGRGSEIVRGDLLDVASLDHAFDGVRTAFYLVHSMGQGGDFAEQDRRAARNFGAAAKDAGVARIIYLGGLGTRGPELSRHLRSRLETGEILRESGVPVVELRSSIILGPGSTSFELVRGLTERLPIMICPRWVRTLTQPIAIDDVIGYLVEAVDLPPSPDSRVFEIGGRDQVSYLDLMRLYAQKRGLRRLMIPVPVLTPWLSSLWLALVTPVQADVGRELIEGVRTATVVRDRAALEVFSVRPRRVDEAMAEAIAASR